MRKRRAARVTWLYDEHRFGQVELARNFLHEFRGQLRHIDEHSQRIASKAVIGEDIERTELQRHAMSLGLGSEREWTSASLRAR